MRRHRWHNPLPDTALGQALSHLNQRKVEQLTAKLGISSSMLVRYAGSGRYLAGWVRQEIADAVGQPVTELWAHDGHPLSSTDTPGGGVNLSGERARPRRLAFSPPDENKPQVREGRA